MMIDIRRDLQVNPPPELTKTGPGSKFGILGIIQYDDMPGTCWRVGMV